MSSVAGLLPLGHLGLQVVLVHLVTHAGSEAGHDEALGRHAHVDQVDGHLHVLGPAAQVVQVVAHDADQSCQACGTHGGAGCSGKAYGTHGGVGCSGKAGAVAALSDKIFTTRISAQRHESKIHAEHTLVQIRESSAKLSRGTHKHNQLVIAMFFFFF